MDQVTSVRVHPQDVSVTVYILYIFPLTWSIFYIAVRTMYLLYSCALIFLYGRSLSEFLALHEYS